MYCTFISVCTGSRPLFSSARPRFHIENPATLYSLFVAVLYVRIAVCFAGTGCTQPAFSNFDLSKDVAQTSSLLQPHG